MQSKALDTTRYILHTRGTSEKYKNDKCFEENWRTSPEKMLVALTPGCELVPMQVPEK
jgi:hypothetical protein